jgi:hypothetical protein
MANRRFNTQVAQPRKALAKGGKAGGKYPSKGMNKLAKKRPDVAKKIMGYKSGGRMKKMGGGMSTARKDMMAGYYTPDMGMKGGKMYKDGGAVGAKQKEVLRRSRKNKQGYKDRKDESIAMRIRKPRTARQLKDSRDESYGKFGSKAKKSGKINR